MGSKFLVGAASALSATALVVCVLFVGYIYNDMNTFYDDMMEDMEKFQVRAISN